MTGRGTSPRAARPAGTGARTPTASPPGARPAGPCRSGPAPAQPPWRPSAGTTTTTDGWPYRRAYHVHFLSAFPVHAAIRIAALLGGDASARHNVGFPVRRIVPSGPDCQVCAILVVHVEGPA